MNNIHNFKPDSNVIVILNPNDDFGDGKTNPNGDGKTNLNGDGSVYPLYSNDRNDAHILTFQQALNMGWSIFKLFPVSIPN